MKNLFCEGLMENDISKLLMVPKSDLHNHSGKGCTRAWLEYRLKIKTDIGFIVAHMKDVDLQELNELVRNRPKSVYGVGLFFILR